MDWKTILKAQQTDFIARLESGDLLHCDKEGKHSEITVISGEKLKQLRDFCWEMAEIYTLTGLEPIVNIFIKSMKTQLGEEVVKIRLADFVTEVDYKQPICGNEKVDFTLTSDSSVGIQIKAKHGNFQEVKWSISREEITKNKVLVCILIQEEVSVAETEYHLILAGFLPTDMIPVTGAIASVKVNELLYAGGLHGYLDALKSVDFVKYFNLAEKCFSKRDYTGALAHCNQALLLQPNNAQAYCGRGVARYFLDDHNGAIEDYTQAINIDPNYAKFYYKRGLSRSKLGYDQAAIEDFKTAAGIYKKEGHEKYYQDSMQQIRKIISTW
ncbi:MULTISPECIES: tetratricopeptide repeat protein [unclassified Nodularia (in: cyanobacteria)]|uniref:tetratricopeptide repeat protein n=1 Tax=unclassified Nodularia (in: cyanobacteria) TaxID=2656917 RepID=UPI001880C526|nr:MULTISPECIES: tetratricopeptide repeat protein [unclassified Nodularia (in: cyanobacteria)]MBE9201536.1 tetratricopeptide repeat protein [Nodularia sp. LEGE 06071]MCC2694395.1 tetratricopeptide repeat protein [Nodularia sp. LEGE 04288]